MSEGLYDDVPLHILDDLMARNQAAQADAIRLGDKELLRSAQDGENVLRTAIRKAEEEDRK